MRPARVSKLLGLNQKTVTNWTDNPLLNRFFSPDAASDDGRTRSRDYNEQDIFVLNTIRLEREKNTEWKTIAQILENGVLDHNLPASSLLVEAPAPAVQYERFVALLNERDNALQAIERHIESEKKKDELIEHLRQEMEQLHRQIGDVERLRVEDAVKDEMIAGLSREIQQLNRELGRLEARLEIRTNDENEGSEKA